MEWCKECNALFEEKNKYNRHRNSKKCKSKRGCLYECDNCFKKYKKEGFYNNHLIICQKKKEDKLTIINNNNVVNNNNLNQIIINNNFQFNLPNQPSIEHITQEKLLEVCNKTFPNMIRELMRLTYFDKTSPGNMHWCIQYPKDTYGALKYNHDSKMLERWITKEIIDISFENMVNKIEPVVTQIIKDKKVYPYLNQRQKDNLNLFFKYFGITNLSENNPSQYENIKMMAFSNSIVSIEMWKKLNYHIP